MRKLVLFFLICMAAMRALAATEVIFNDNERHLRWKLYPYTKEAMLGTGDYEHENAILMPPFGDEWWDNSVNYWKDLVIPSTIEYNGDTYTVTKVAWHAFERCYRLETIVLPPTIKEIGGGAFYLCTYMTSANIPEGVTTIGPEAFYACFNVEGLTLPSTVETIGESAFIDCEKMTRITIPACCRSVGSNAFSWCISVDTLIIEDSDEPLSLGYATTFGPNWEPYCKPYSYPVEFARGLFNDCPLKVLHVGRNLSYNYLPEIDSPFEHCYHLGTNSSTGKPLFKRTGNNYKRMTFGKGVTEIPAKLFWGAILPRIVLPDSLRRIGDSAFEKAVSQTSIVIPELCDSIGQNAFSSESYPFTIKHMDCRAAVPPRIHKYAFAGGDIVVSVPAGSRAAYNDNPNWAKYLIADAADTMAVVELKYANSLYGQLALRDLTPTDVARLKVSGTLGNDDWNVIGQMTNLYDLDLSESNCTDLNQIKALVPHLLHFKFPNGITTIPAELFWRSPLSGELELPASCKAVQTRAFQQSNISKVTIDGPVSVGTSAFSFCENLKEAVVRGNATLQVQSFYHTGNRNAANTGLEALTLGDGVTVRSQAFYDCGNLRHITIEGDVNNIAADAFALCDNISVLTFDGKISGTLGAFAGLHLSKLEINDLPGWTSMSFLSAESNPMANADTVTINGSAHCTLTLPASVKTVGNYAFYGCGAIDSLAVEGASTKIGTMAFANCSNLAAAVLNDSISSIGTGAFSGCAALRHVNLPGRLSGVPSRVLKGCAAVEAVTIPGNARIIGSSAFAGCTSLTGIELPVSCATISDHAFEGCESLTAISLPYNTTVIGDSAFCDCKNLAEAKALWVNPPKVAPTTFSGVGKKCTLYVPIGSVPNYYNNGWGRLPIIMEGYCVVNLENNDNGSLEYAGKLYTGSDNAIVIDCGTDVSMTVRPDDGFYVGEIVLDGESLTPGIHTTDIDFAKISDNHTISLGYAPYVVGDVNNDASVDADDAIAIAGNVTMKPSGTFIARAADTNVDNDIDVGDIRGIANIIAVEPDTTTTEAVNTVTMRYEPVGLADECLLCVELANADAVAGLQMKLTLSEGMSLIADDSGFDPIRTAGMGIKDIVQIADSCHMLLCASANPAVIERGEGNVLRLRLKVPVDAASSVLLHDMRFADKRAVVHRVADMVSSVPSEVLGVTNAAVPSLKKNVRKYVKEGQLLIESESGTYSATGAKVNP